MYCNKLFSFIYINLFWFVMSIILKIITLVSVVRCYDIPTCTWFTWIFEKLMQHDDISSWSSWPLQYSMYVWMTVNKIYQIWNICRWNYILHLYEISWQINSQVRSDFASLLSSKNFHLSQVVYDTWVPHSYRHRSH